MNKVLITISIILSLLTGFSGWLKADSQDVVTISDDVKLIKITDGVWRHITTLETKEYGPVPANGLIVIDGEKAVMIDTPWNGEQTARLIDWLEKVKNVKLETVIATHRHTDCTGGLDIAHKRGAISYALDRTIELAKKEGDQVPMKGFKDALTLNCGSTVLELFYPGGGHTIDNIVVWLPKKRILFGGCAVKSTQSKTLGNLNDAVPREWPSTLMSLLKKYPDAKWVVPGHGKPGGLEYIKHTLKLLMAVKE